MNKAQAGKLGGLATAAKYGSQYMSSLGRKGATALHQRYQIVPLGIAQYALVNRETHQIKATF